MSDINDILSDLFISYTSIVLIEESVTKLKKAWFGYDKKKMSNYIRIIEHNKEQAKKNEEKLIMMSNENIIEATRLFYIKCKNYIVQYPYKKQFFTKIYDRFVNIFDDKQYNDTDSLLAQE